MRTVTRPTYVRMYVAYDARCVLIADLRIRARTMAFTEPRSAKSRRRELSVKRWSALRSADPTGRLRVFLPFALCLHKCPSLSSRSSLSSSRALGRESPDVNLRYLNLVARHAFPLSLRFADAKHDELRQKPGKEDRISVRFLLSIISRDFVRR